MWQILTMIVHLCFAHDDQDSHARRLPHPGRHWNQPDFGSGPSAGIDRGRLVPNSCTQCRIRPRCESVAYHSRGDLIGLMRYTVILVPGDDGWVSATVPAMPGCVSQGRTREEALDNVREAMEGWIEVEAARGGSPLHETPALVLDGVSTAIQIIDDMRAAGELNTTSGYNLELASVELRESLAA